MATVPPRSTWVDGPPAVDATDLIREIKTPLDFVYERPYLHAYRSTALTISPSSWNMLDLYAEVDDRPDANHSITANRSRFLPATPGYWTVRAQITFNPHSTGNYRGIQIRQNSADSAVGGTERAKFIISPNPGEMTVPVGPVDIPLSVGDYIQAFVYQDSGTNLDCQAGSYQTYLQARWVGEL